LRRVFGHEDFRPLQAEAVTAQLGGGDLLMILPTGGGKSLCYQLPALMQNGVTVVISPLLALMHDQVRALQLLGVEAAMIGSSMDQAAIGRVYEKLRRGEVKLLYVAPERLASSRFVDFLQTLRPARFVIDEAHCVSEWGHEFREEYRRLGRLRALFPDVPLAAFTATATPAVEADILVQLRMPEALCLRGSVARENLFIAARPRRGDGLDQLEAFVRRFEGESGIVYTFTRKEAEKVAEKLTKRGIACVAYHAGMSHEARAENYRAFVHDEVPVVAATVAFGMGIDKSDIRFVAHTAMPKTLENYYQEIGRAGREGERSETLLLYGSADAAQRASLIETLPEGAYKTSALDKLERMRVFCLSESCRHAQLRDYFGERAGPCGTGCDNCVTEIEKREITTEARMFLSAVYRTGQRFGKGHIIAVLRGMKNAKIAELGHENLSVYGVGKQLQKGTWDTVCERLLETGMVTRDAHRGLVITPEGAALLRGEKKLFIRADRLREAPSRAPKSRLRPFGDEAERELFERLRKLRKALAERDGVPAYMVFNDKTLRLMAASRPKDTAAMLAVDGVGEKKMARYGEAFLEAIRKENEDV